MAAVTWVCNHIWSFIAVVVAFSFIIAIHELGHFIMARRVGIRCPRFSIGFGPRLFAFEFRGTEFSVCLLPFGGYVMMLGEDPDSDDKQDEFNLVSSYLPENLLPASRDDIAAAIAAKEAEISDDPEEKKRFRSVLGHVRYLPDKVYQTARQLEGNFNDTSIPARMAVVLGGVTMNFISALILFWIIGACYGLVDLSPKSMPIVMKVFDNSPAAAAGVAYGDEITAVNGEAIVSGSEMIKAIGACPALPAKITLKRGDKQETVELIPNAMIGGLVFHPSANVKGLPKIVEISSFGDENDSRLAAGDVITAVNGNKVSSVETLLTQFQELAQAENAKNPRPEKVSVNLSVQGKGEVKVDLPAAYLQPVGKIGIMPAQVTEFKFIKHTINEVQSVAEDSTAAKLGFRAGDEVHFVNGARVADIDSLNEVLLATKDSISAEHPLVFDISRGQEHVVIKSDEGLSDTVGMGLTLRPITMGLVVKRSFITIGRLIIAPVIIVQQLVNKMLSPALVKASMSGPVGIMQMIFELSDQGFGKLLYITALINAAVGAFNVIPFPALDGGRFFVLLVSWIRGREVDPRKEAMVHNIGLIVLLGLVALVTLLDFQRILAGVPLTK